MNKDHTEEREVLNTMLMIESGFLSRLKNKNLKPVPKEIQEAQESSTITNTEALLLDLFEIRDGLIDLFKRSENNEGDSEVLVGHIDKIGSCIRKLGGAVDKFDPFSAKCGLKDPDLKLNAQRVIENTKKSYSLGDVSGDKVSADGKTINITFSGVKGNTCYKAVGTLVAHKSWVGNEGVDYIYSPASGKISVKAISDDGKWIDKSSEYNISWELFEQDKNQSSPEKKMETKEEIQKSASNNIDDEEIGDFPIENKNEIQDK